MALIVENGTGLADAEAYISVADATTYHAKLGNADAWDAIDDKEAALRKATNAMTQFYRRRWLGFRVTQQQALDWPRAWVPFKDGPVGYRANPSYYAQDAVPTEGKNACAELALKTATDDLNPDLTQQALSKTVGPISITFDRSSPQAKRFQAVEHLLVMLVEPTSGAVNIVRV